jgi:hypothetical protein
MPGTPNRRRPCDEGWIVRPTLGTHIGAFVAHDTCSWERCKPVKNAQGRRSRSNVLHQPFALLVFLLVAFAPIPVRANERVGVELDWNVTTGRSHLRQSVLQDIGVTGALARYNAAVPANARYLGWYFDDGADFNGESAVAQLSRPTARGTHWNFSRLDQIVVPFLEMMRDKDPIVDFATIPQWMFKTERLIAPNDRDAAGNRLWGVAGEELVDPSGDEVVGRAERAADRAQPVAGNLHLSVR